MKKYLLVLIMLLPLKIFGSTLDVDYYKLNTTLDITDNILIVKLDLKATNNTQDSVFTFLFNSESKIQDILLNIENKLTKLQFEQSDDNLLTIYLPQTDTAYISMHYSIMLDSTSDGEFVFRREDKWYPFNYDDNAYFSLTSERDDNYYSIGQHKTPILSINFPLLYIPKKSYRQITHVCENISIDFYFLSKDSSIINKMMTQVCSSFTFYSDYIGEYKHKTLSFVELSDFKAAQSLSSIVIFGSMFFKYYEYEGMGEWPLHELAHQWIGSSVFIKHNKKILGRSFIEESLTEYLKKVYIENQFGIDSLKVQLQNDSSVYHPIANSENDIPLLNINFPSTKEKAIIVYRKGPMVFHKLRNMIGEEKWEKLIKDIYARYQDKSFSFENFRSLLFDSVTDSTIINRFDNDLSSVGFDFLKE